MSRLARDPDRRQAQLAVLRRLYDIFLILKPESWRTADPAWITPTQQAILYVVVRSRIALSVSDIARRLDCSRSVVSRAVRALELKCYVFRVVDRRDRRRVLVRPRSSARPPAGWAPEWDWRVPGGLALLTMAQLAELRAGLQIFLDGIRSEDRDRRGW